MNHAKISRRLRRDLLISSGLPLNQQVWIKLVGCSEAKLVDTITQNCSHWPTIGGNIDVVNNNPHGFLPLIKQSSFDSWLEPGFGKKQLDRLATKMQTYNGQANWQPNDYLALNCSPSNIPNSYIGIALLCETKQFLAGEWGDFTGFPYHLPFVIEIQHGTWPRYLI